MRRLRTDFVETFLVEIAALAAGLWLYRAASLQLGVAGFAEYALARRVISLLQPVVVLGMDVGVVRYVAMAMGDRAQIARHAGTAAAVMAGAVVVVCGVLLLFPEPSARLLFGTSRSSHLIVPLLWMIAGGALLPFAYSYLRGRSWGRPANLLQLLAQAVGPVVAITVAGSRTTWAIGGIGIGWVAASAAMLLAFRPPLVRPAGRDLSRPLVRYGLARFPGDLIQVALFSVPPILVAHAVDQPTAAVFAMGIAVVTMVGSMFVPVGHVLLPEASRLVKTGDTLRLKRHVVRLLAVVSVVATAGVAAAVALAPWIIHSYLELELAGAVGELRLVVWAAIPFALYMAARRILDAVHEAPVNALNLGVAFGAFLAVAGLGALGGFGALGVRVGFLAGCAVLAALTLRSLRRALFT